MKFGDLEIGDKFTFDWESKGYFQNVWGVAETFEKINSTEFRYRYALRLGGDTYTERAIIDPETEVWKRQKFPLTIQPN